MRYITVVLTLSDDAVQSSSQQQMQGSDDDPSEIWIDDTLVATQEAINYLNLLDDGTVVGLSRFRGDANQLATIESEFPEVISCTVTGGETWLAYTHFKPNKFDKILLELIDIEAISIDWPMLETAEGLQVTLFGEDTALQRMVAGLPDEIDLRLKQTGEYQPDLGDPAGQLTDRQKEILRAAIAAGYYDIPRRATQRDLAAELGLSPGTIGDHLRRIEAKIMQSLIV